MKKLVIAVAAVGALVAGGAAIAFSLNEDKAQAATAGHVSDLVISADDKAAIKVEITGGPEGKRQVSVAAGQQKRVPSTEGDEYRLTATTEDGKEIGDVKVPGGVKETWDCFASDDHGPPAFGCVIGAE